MDEAHPASGAGGERGIRERTAEIEKAANKALAERQRFESVLNHVPAYLVLLTPDDRVVFANRLCEERFGPPRNQHCYEYLFKRGNPCADCRAPSVLETQAPQRWEWTGPDGRAYAVHGFPFRDADDSPLVMEVIRDITEAKRADAELKNLNETLERRVAERTAELRASEQRLRWGARRDELLSTTAARLLQSTDPQALVEDLCREVMAFLDCHAFFNFLAEPGGLRMKLNACAGIPKDDAEKIQWLDFGTAVCGCVARDRRRIIAEDIPSSGDPRVQLVKSYGIQAYCCHPLLVQNQLIGTLSFGTRSRPRFSNADIDVMDAVSGMVAIAMNRIRFEIALRDSEERYRALFNNMTEGFALHEVVTDAGGRPADYRFLDVNPAFERMTGLKRADVVGRRILEVLPETELHWIESYGKVALAGEPAHFENFSSALGRWFEVFAYQPAPRQFAVVFTDITERKIAEQEISRSRQDLRRAQAVGQMGWWRLDTESNVLTWSDENYRIFGLPKGTPLTYQTFLQCIHPDDRDHVDAEWDAALRGKPYDIEHRIMASGAVRWVREKAYLEFDASGKLKGGFGITQDVTKRKVAEQQLRELNETLEQRVDERTAEVSAQADQLRALASQLSQAELRERKRLAKILHDHIQQLIVAARMQVEWLAHEADPRRVRATLQGVDSILLEALQASRDLTVDLSPPILHEAGLAGGLNWLAARLRDKNQFAVSVRADNKAEPADEETRFLLFECARELLFNAVKHSGADTADVALVRTDDNHVKLMVTDGGKGFDPDRLKKRGSGEATFGLFSIQERLAHIGGRMEVETAPGRGTRITLTAPIGEAPAGEALAGEALGAAADEPGRGATMRMRRKDKTRRVLIVDDHKIVREGLAGLLRFEADIDVVGEAADGPEAIALAEKLKPDVVVMDINLGEMNGVEASRRIRAANPRTAIIGLSMHVDPSVARAMREAGAAAYLTKGGPSKNLIDAIRACPLHE